jgi:hypothetical protein
MEYKLDEGKTGTRENRSRALRRVFRRGKKSISSEVIIIKRNSGGSERGIEESELGEIARARRGNFYYLYVNSKLSPQDIREKRVERQKKTSRTRLEREARRKIIIFINATRAERVKLFLRRTFPPVSPGGSVKKSGLVSITESFLSTLASAGKRFSFPDRRWAMRSGEEKVIIENSFEKSS